MAMRDLVTGGAACAVPGAPSSSSNLLGTLANALIGCSTKTQERLNELPGTTLTGPDGSHDYRTEGPLTTLPGSETEHQQFQHPNAQNSEFLHSFRLHEGLADAWKEVHGSESQVQFAEFEQLYNNGVRSQLQPTLDGILPFGRADKIGFGPHGAYHVEDGQAIQRRQKTGMKLGEGWRGAGTADRSTPLQDVAAVQKGHRG